MSRAFNVDAPRSSFELPALTRQQIQALMLDLDESARDVVIQAVALLWQREIGGPDRDLAAEIDEIKAKVALMTTRKQMTTKTSITVQDLREWQRKIQAVSALELDALIVEAFPYDDPAESTSIPLALVEAIAAEFIGHPIGTTAAVARHAFTYNFNWQDAV